MASRAAVWDLGFLSLQFECPVVLSSLARQASVPKRPIDHKAVCDFFFFFWEMIDSFWFGSRQWRVKRQGVCVTVTRIEVIFAVELPVKDVRLTKHMSDQDILPLVS